MRWFYLGKDDLFTCVDDEDYERLKKYNIRFKIKEQLDGLEIRAVAYITVTKYKGISFLILNPGNKLEVDHINGETLDNRRSNLRICSRSLNALNKKRARGYSFCKNKNKFRVIIRKNTIGYFDTPEKAHEAYLNAWRELIGPQNCRDAEPMPLITEEEKEIAINEHKQWKEERDRDRVKDSIKKMAVQVKNNHGIVFNSVREAARFYGASCSHISACCIGKIKTCHGMTWSYVTHGKQVKQENQEQ